MAIPASQIVAINPRLLTSGGEDLEFNGLFLTQSEKIPSTQIVLPFPDPDSVADYFGESSWEYVAAVTYFKGYNNSFKKPRAIYFASFPKSDRPAYIRGGDFEGLPAEILTDLKQITNGSLSLTLGPGTFNAVGLDFSNATSLSEIALIIQDALMPPLSPATAGKLEGAAITLSSLVGIADGAFIITIDGTPHLVSGIAITTSSTIATIATDIQYKLGSLCNVYANTNGGITIESATTGTSGSVGFPTAAAIGTDIIDALGLSSSAGAVFTPGADVVYPTNCAKVEFSSLYNAFILTSSIAGAGSGVTYATGSIAGILNLTQDKGATLSPGIIAQSLTTTMNDILNLTQNFVCFSTLWKASEDEALELAQWSTARGVNYLYVFWDDSDDNLKLGPVTIAERLAQANIGSTCAVYNSIEYAAMIMGTAASIDFERRQGTITFAFKAQEGLAANVVTGVGAQNLALRQVNFMGDYATRNDNFILLYPGCMFGEWKWIDTYLNAVWLTNAMQVAVMAGLKQSPRVPYNDDGYTQVRAWITDILNKALYNGVIDPGVNLSESIKAELFREAGVDISQDLDIDGYYLQIVDASPQVRMQRTSPEISCWYTYAGSIHKIEVASTVIV